MQTELYNHSCCHPSCHTMDCRNFISPSFWGSGEFTHQWPYRLALRRNINNRPIETSGWSFAYLAHSIRTEDSASIMRPRVAASDREFARDMSLAADTCRTPGLVRSIRGAGNLASRPSHIHASVPGPRGETSRWVIRNRYSSHRAENYSCHS